MGTPEAFLIIWIEFDLSMISNHMPNKGGMTFLFIPKFRNWQVIVSHILWLM